MSDRLRCCQCSKGATFRRLEHNPWLHVMDPDGSTYAYCDACAGDGLDEWGPVAVDALEHGHRVFFSLLFGRGDRLGHRTLELDILSDDVAA